MGWWSGCHSDSFTKSAFKSDVSEGLAAAKNDHDDVGQSRVLGLSTGCLFMAATRQFRLLAPLLLLLLLLTVLQRPRTKKTCDNHTTY